MANNKVVLSDGTTIMDLTGDTVTPESLEEGFTAHDKSGSAIVGTNRTPEATDAVSGTVKTNSAQSVYLDETGKLVVGGRMGQFPSTTGLYAPNDREPRDVKDYSLLITDALGIEMAANRALAIVSGFSITVNKAAAGSTVYYAKNTYINRIIAKVCEGGYVSRDEATSKVETIIPVVSVLINGQTFTPDSSPDDANNLIQITLEETANPTTQITQLRMFGVMKSYASAHIGNGIHTDGSGGRSLILGGGLTKSGGNDHCMVGQQMYASGNGNAMFGRQHIGVKNRGFMSGTGHDSTNARSESAAAFGEWSVLDLTTLFAVGNGTSATARSNAFWVLADGRVKASGTPTDNNDLTTKAYVDTAIAASAPTVTTFGNADFTYEQVLDAETGNVINECVAYSTAAGNNNEPKAVKVGRTVNLCGAFKNVNARPDNTAFVMGKVPTGCEPLYQQHILQQGSNQYKWLLTIATDGTLSCQRYATAGTASAVGDKAWLNLNACYISAT